MTVINFHLIDVLHLSDKFRLYAVPIDVWSLSFGISPPPAGRLAADAVIKGSAIIVENVKMVLTRNDQKRL